MGMVSDFRKNGAGWVKNRFCIIERRRDGDEEKGQGYILVAFDERVKVRSWEMRLCLIDFLFFFS